MAVRWEPMKVEDLDAVTALAEAVHPDYPESPAVFAERLALFSPGCWVARDSVDEEAPPVGYALAHPALLNEPPPLDYLLERLPDAAQCLYIHDVAVHPLARAQGLGRDLVRQAEEVARDRGLDCLALTAVNRSTGYWRSHGFEVQEPSPALRAKLLSYGVDAAYMVRHLEPRR